ncbi:MAG: NAD-dependent epimerase/dehydratase [Candidatus Eremiobacteraeota bacterium]|nr:NAD-dependent epimerase/dehydratase [Candidatus Eremiobacteraeota bacterium]MBV8280864.1 NAD-dependent epimerase/dehydratase [Candidatus Eremiobacteraeota bacterium]
MRRLLLTGATGFIGREALHQIDRERYDVHALSRRPPAGPADGISWHAADLLDAGQLADAVANIAPTHLLHLAWEAGRSDYRTAPRNLDWLAAGVHLARAFREHGGVRAVYAGTCAEYQPASSLYATSKSAVAASVSEYARTDGWHFAWGRIFWPYGPGSASRRLVPYVIERLLVGEVAHCSPGSQQRDFIHVSDVASALVALLGSDVDGPVDIGSGEGTPVRTVVEWIARDMNRADLVSFDGPPPLPEEPDTMVARPTELRSLGWACRPLREGLTQTIEWYRERMPA